MCSAFVWIDRLKTASAAAFQYLRCVESGVLELHPALQLANTAAAPLFDLAWHAATGHTRRTPRWRQYVTRLPGGACVPSRHGRRH